MQEKDITDFIIKLEKNYPVGTWIIDEIHIWPLVRLAIGNYLTSREILGIKKKKSISNDLLSMVITGKEYIKFLYRDFKMAITDSLHNDVKDIAYVLMLTYCTDRRVFIPEKGEWYNYVSEPIEQLLNNNKLTVKNYEMTIPYMENNMPRDNRTVLISYKLYFASVIWKISYFLGDNKIKKYSLDRYGEFLSFLKRNNLECGAITKEALFYTVYKIKRACIFFESILDKCQAKCIIVPDWRDQYPMALALAAWHRKISYIEIQHGYYGTTRFTHSGWTNIPENGYELMPTHYWCWTRAEAEKINESHGHGCAIAGFPQIALFWHDEKNEVVYSYKKKMNAFFKDKKNVILITLQGLYPFEKYPYWLLEVIRDCGDKYFWLLRKHVSAEFSGQDRFCEELQGLSNVDCEEATKLPLLMLLQYVKVNVTLSSSAVIEAAMEGVPSMILDGARKDFFEELAKDGAVCFVDDKIEFLSVLEKWMSFNPLEDKWHDNMVAVNEFLNVVKRGQRYN